MQLFTNCYTSDGYLPCSMSLPSGTLVVASKQQMYQMVPAEIVWLMTESDVRFFSGVMQNRRVVHIRNVPTRLEDENRRNCFIHLTFIDLDENLQKSLTSYILYHYLDFVRQVNHMICYAGKKYEVIGSALEQLVEYAQKSQVRSLQDNRALVVLGETSVDYFCSHNVLGIHSSKDADWARLPAVDINQLPMPIRKENTKMMLYFYCNSPQEGFHFLQVDPLTGNTLANERTGQIGIDPLIYRMITSNGANMALCHKQNTHTFFVRHICSPEKNERIGFAMQNAEEQMARQFAAWAVFDYPTFCAAVVRCVEVDGGICSINPKYVKHLMQGNKAIDPSVSQTEMWRKLTTPGSNKAKPYSLLVVDYDIQDFNNNLNMSVDSTMVEFLMNTAQLADLRKGSFSSSTNPSSKQADSLVHQSKHTITAEQTKKEQASSQHDQQNQTNISESKQYKSTAPNEQQQTNVPIVAKDETVDLLRTKWFIPTAIGIIVLVILTCIIIAISGRKAAESGIDKVEPTAVIKTVETIDVTNEYQKKWG